jgi:hypothetical protein
MSDKDVNKQRRTVLRIAATGVAVVPLSALLGSRAAAVEQLPRLSEDDRAAKALQYVHDASASTSDKHKDGQVCKNCNLIRSDEGEWRPCAIFPGKAVNANGWCAAWVGRI